MKKIIRSLDKIDDDIKSAGQSFLGLRMEDLIIKFSELEDKEKKATLICDYFKNQIGTYDSDIGGTRTRVNAAIRIIKADKVEYALRKIDGSDSRVFIEAVSKAKDTLTKINKGILILPKLS